MIAFGRFIRFVTNTGKKILHKLDKKNVVFSIGENCLTDDLLSRNNIKSFSSPYSTGRSNIEYILSFENERFTNFLNPQYLTYENLDDTRIVRNTRYVGVENQYEDTVSRGFEFTHHDVLGNVKAKKTLKRRCDRVLRIRNKNVILVYHHRLCKKTNIELLTDHLSKLSEIYRERGNRVQVYMFTQQIVENDADRRVEKKSINEVNTYVFYTKKEWKGNDSDVFFARCDNDLLSIMIEDIKKGLR